MIKGRYRPDGDYILLRNKTALLREDPDNDDSYLAQFDDLKLAQYAHGWHKFSKKDFINVSDIREDS